MSMFNNWALTQFILLWASFTLKQLLRVLVVDSTMEEVWFSKDSQTDHKTWLDLFIQATLQSNACQILSYMAALHQ